MKPIIFIDSGDTLVDESSEIRNNQDVVVKADLIEGSKDFLLELKRRGYVVALVADGLKASFDNIYLQHDFSGYFDARAISEVVGVQKPDSRMFQTAMDALELKEEDKRNIFMIGNNVKKDIVGANRFGIHSVLLTWSPRYDMTFHSEEETPDIRVEKLSELLPYLEEHEQKQ